MRVWFSGPRLFNGLVRPGISLGKEDFRPLSNKFNDLIVVQGHPVFKEYKDYLKDRAMAHAEREFAVFKKSLLPTRPLEGAD